MLHKAPKCLHQINCHQNHIMSHYATALVTLCSANKVTTAGGTYSDLGSMYTDYEYRQALALLCVFMFFPKNITAILPTLREHVTWTWQMVQSTQQLVCY